MLGLILRQRDTNTTERIGLELGTLVGTRWKEADDRESAMLAHTKALRRPTVIVVICAIVSTVFVVYAAFK